MGKAKNLYEKGNHLGNVLVTVSDKKIPVSANGTTIDYYEADVVTANDYYPGGMMMLGRKYAAGSKYRYGFNGKENDNEVKGEGNQQDYGMRIYDSRLMRFLSVDPLAKKFAELSPYQYAENCPIKFIDLDGAESLDPADKPTGVAHISTSNPPGGIMEEKAAMAAGNYFIFKTTTSDGTEYFTARLFYSSGTNARMYEDQWIIGPESLTKFAQSAKVYEEKATKLQFAINIGGSNILSLGTIGDMWRDSWNPVEIGFGLSILGKSVLGLASVGPQVRPTWQESEIDILAENPGYRPQVAFKNGKEVSINKKGSVRPEGYKTGSSIEVKNYGVTTEAGKKSLVNNIVKQVRQRFSNLPAGTTQTIILDFRGQQMSKSAALQVFRDVRLRITTQTSSTRILVGAKF